MSQPQSQFVRELEAVVFTGDLVGSTKLAPEAIAEAMRALETASRLVLDAFGAGQAPRFTRFRGDGWQCRGPRPQFCLRAALILRAHLGALGRSFDTRLSIGVGAGILDPDAPTLDGATGPAFEISGRGLDKMAHAPRFALGWETPPEGARLIQAIFGLADEISRNWTPAQARVFAAALGPRQRPSQEALARDLDITQQVVARHLAGGGDWALREALQALEDGA